MLRDLLHEMFHDMSRKTRRPDQALQQQHLARGRGLFSEQRLQTLESSLGGEGLYGWHSEQEGDPPGGRIPFKFLPCLSRPVILVPSSEEGTLHG
jgi:hypothetical protein